MLRAFIDFVVHRRLVALCATLAQTTGQLAGINPGDGDDTLLFQVIGQRLSSTEIGQTARTVPHDQTRSVDL